MTQKPRKRETFFPLLMKLEGRPVVVVGGGTIAERKIHSLLECGAVVTVISPRLKGSLAGLVDEKRITHIARIYRRGDLEGAAIAIVAVDDREAGKQIAEDAGRLNIPVNVVDRPELCTFIVPAVVRRGHLTLAVSTGGASPAWSRNIKQRLAAEFGDEYTSLFDALVNIRRTVLCDIDDPALRRKILMKLADESILDLARSQPAEQFEPALRTLVSQWSAEEADRDD